MERQRAVLAKSAHFSKSPPTPTPRIMGGHAFPPANRAVSATKSMISCSVAEGVNIFIRLMFSLPNPLGATIKWIESPSTSLVCRIAGVLSPVLPLRMGSATTEQRSRPFRYPRRTPSFTASSKDPLIWTSCPISANTTAIPVSWQTGISSSRAASRLSHKSFITAMGSGSVSRLAARRMADSTSSGKILFALMHSSSIASLITEASISLIFIFLRYTSKKRSVYTHSAFSSFTAAGHHDGKNHPVWNQTSFHRCSV